MGILRAFVLKNHVLHIPVGLESSKFSSFQEVILILNPQGKTFPTPYITSTQTFHYTKTVY